MRQAAGNPRLPTRARVADRSSKPPPTCGGPAPASGVTAVTGRREWRVLRRGMRALGGVAGGARRQQSGSSTARSMRIDAQVRTAHPYRVPNSHGHRQIISYPRERCAGAGLAQHQWRSGKPGSARGSANPARPEPGWLPARLWCVEARQSSALRRQASRQGQASVSLGTVFLLRAITASSLACR